MSLTPGRLRHRVTIFHPAAPVQDPETGGYSDTFDEGPTIWAEVISLAGREAVVDQTLQQISVYRITVRYREDIGANDQLRYGTKTLNVHAADDPDGSREALVIVADTSAPQKLPS